MEAKLSARRQQAFALTLIACVLTAGVGWMLGPMITALAVMALPVPLFLLWFSSDTFRSDERKASETARVRGAQADFAAQRRVDHLDDAIAIARKPATQR